MRELSRYFQGTFTAATTGTFDTSKLFPACFAFRDGYPQRHPARAVPTNLPQPERRSVSRVGLSLSVFLRTRGSHCRADIGEIVGGSFSDGSFPLDGSFRYGSRTIRPSYDCRDGM